MQLGATAFGPKAAVGAGEAEEEEEEDGDNIRAERSRIKKRRFLLSQIFLTAVRPLTLSKCFFSQCFPSSKSSLFG